MYDLTHGENSNYITGQCQVPGLICKNLHTLRLSVRWDLTRDVGFHGLFYNSCLCRSKRGDNVGKADAVDVGVFPTKCDVNLANVVIICSSASYMCFSLPHYFVKLCPVCLYNAYTLCSDADSCTTHLLLITGYSRNLSPAVCWTRPVEICPLLRPLGIVLLHVLYFSCKAVGNHSKQWWHFDYMSSLYNEFICQNFNLCKHWLSSWTHPVKACCPLLSLYIHVESFPAVFLTFNPI